MFWGFWWWRFARDIAPIVTTSFILSSNKIHNGAILTQVHLVAPKTRFVGSNLPNLLVLTPFSPQPYTVCPSNLTWPAYIKVAVVTSLKNNDESTADKAD